MRFTEQPLISFSLLITGGVGIPENSINNSIYTYQTSLLVDVLALIFVLELNLGHFARP